MLTMSLIISDDDPEEGEIIDDDFEDISDNSIIEPFHTGKFIAPKEQIPAISLSSVSDSDVPEKEDNKCKTRHHRKPPKRKNKSFRRKRCSHNHRRHLFSDSDSDEFLDRKLQKQLKAAIRVDTEECHKNSLRTRLRAMTKNNENDLIYGSIGSEMPGNKPEIINEAEHLKESSNEPDEDLIQLRLEALRTAVLNKFEHRKKRKIKEILENGDDLTVIDKVDTSEINKENTQLINDSEPPNKKMCNEKSEEKPCENEEEIIHIMPPPDEDEDVLRALLLASMSKKITKEVVPTKTVLNTQALKESVIPKQTAHQMNKVLPTTVTKKEIVPFKNHSINRQNFKSHMKTIARIHPIIINVDESDTDDESANNTIKNVVKQPEILPKPSEIESSVEKFLKEQRAKVEAESGLGCLAVPERTEPLGIIKPNDSSKPIEKPIESSKPTDSCKLTGIKGTPNKPISTSVILEKSSVKLLPKNKQIEYQKLLQKLKNAERRPRVRRLSSRVTGEPKPVGNTHKKIVRNKMSVSVKDSVHKVEQYPDIKNDARTLHFALKEMQRQKNGRLQIEEKYVVLTPIIKKINEATTERKKYDQEVKRLLQELAEAKSKLRETHISFSTHVQELIKQKQEIESSSVKPNDDRIEGTKPKESKSKEGILQNKKQKDVAFTSTPKKDHPPLESFEASTIPSLTPNVTPNHTISEVMSNSMKGKLMDDEILLKETTLTNAPKEGIEQPNEEIEIDGNNSDVIEAPINPGDPNDIDRIYKTHNVVPEYRSPLDCVKR
ncbi:unnamed protein product [Phaedon cochleariae]|uniref:Uncharacterized protein n=1 Tax=Phaedon cochleariae TaxID=80249 RepID=A0A9N9SEL3_PHACE|nr:unnamed protein product [Phaedon cochleariae]